MKSFSEYKKELEHKILYKTDNFEYIKFNDWDFFNNKNDIVYILPYLIEQKAIYMMEELVPSYSYDDNKVSKKYANFINGIVKKSESVDSVIVRKLKNACGLSLLNTKSFEHWGPLYVFPDSSVKCYFSIVTLYNNEFVLGSRKLDNKRDMNSNLLKISLKDLLNMDMNDVISSYILQNFKDFLNKTK